MLFHLKTKLLRHYQLESRLPRKNNHDKWGIYFSEELGHPLEYKENSGKVDYIYDSFLEAYSQTDNDGEVWF